MTENNAVRMVAISQASDIYFLDNLENDNRNITITNTI